ncbi:MAG: SLC13 family permease [Actinomycetaceae bacterium]|nr:SLC13 family permease [Actinomycetaceae bacterium]MDY5854837.1 SLC13 family permease [Arcanobacterium sp.]
MGRTTDMHKKLHTGGAAHHGKGRSTESTVSTDHGEDIHSKTASEAGHFRHPRFLSPLHPFQHFFRHSIHNGIHISTRGSIGIGLLALTGMAMLAGLYSPMQAGILWARMWPVLLFALSMSVVASFARQAGFFHASAHYVHVLSRGNFLALFLIFCFVTVTCTVFLSLDTAAVMLTPAAIALARSFGKGKRPLIYAVIWLANMSSLLLPISNLTNLLAMQRSSLSIQRFTQLTWLPWLVCTLTPIIAILILERDEFRSRPHLHPRPHLRFRLRPHSQPHPRFHSTSHQDFPPVSPPSVAPEDISAMPELLQPSKQSTHPEVCHRGLLLRATFVIAGLCIALAAGVTPWMAGCVGAGLLAISALATPGVSVPRGLIPLTMMTLVVGLFFATDVVGTLGTNLIANVNSTNPYTLAFAGLGLANTANNLPAYLMLEPASSGAPISLIALLIGVNTGPIITPWASLATLLWYEQLIAERSGINWWRFVRRGAVLAPVTVALAVWTLSWIGI